MKIRTQAGFSLIEVMFAIGVLTVGALGLAGVFAQGMQKTISSPGELLATQKASEAIESVFSARDSHRITWAQLQNVSKGGIFKDGTQPMTTDGLDGVVGTADDGPVESVVLPGVDQRLGTADDKTVTLSGYTRQIAIADIPNNRDLRSITVTITYKSGATTRSYTLTALISTFA
jgi:prepilin-type N-terminal cleavage/methylation domain-containing protein